MDGAGAEIRRGFCCGGKEIWGRREKEMKGSFTGKEEKEKIHETE